MVNHCLRWAAEPCVQESWSTEPVAFFWIRSSPTASAAFCASAMFSRVRSIPLLCWSARVDQTPA